MTEDRKRDMNATEEQKQILIHFMADNVDLGKGKFLDSVEGKKIHNSLWNVLSQSLNSTVDGPTRGTAKWQRYWSDMKTRVKRKVAEIRKSRGVTGGGPQLPKTLTDFEERVLFFISPEAAYGVANPEANEPNVRLESDIPMKRTRTEEVEKIVEQTEAFSDVEISGPNTPLSDAESIRDSDFSPISMRTSSKKNEVITRNDVSLLLQQQTELNRQMSTLNTKLDSIESTLERNSNQTNQLLARIAVALEKFKEY